MGSSDTFRQTFSKHCKVNQPVLLQSCFPDCWKVSLIISVFKNAGESSTAKNYHPVCLLSLASKVFEKFANHRIIDHLEKSGLFLVSCMVLGLLDQLQILTSVPDRIVRALKSSGATRAAALDISKNSERVWRAALLHRRMKFQVKYFALFLLSSVIDGFGWFWIGSFHKNIQLILEFLKGPFFVLYFSYNTLMTFLMMLFVILLSMLIILISTLSVIRHLMCGNN